MNVVKYHLSPIILSERVNKVYLVRDKAGLFIPKVEYITSQSNNRIYRIFEKLANIIRFGKKSDIIWSYYLLPHGINAIIASHITKKPVGISLIGTDMNEHLNKSYAFLLKPFLKKALKKKLENIRKIIYLYFLMLMTILNLGSKKTKKYMILFL